MGTAAGAVVAVVLVRVMASWAVVLALGLVAGVTNIRVVDSPVVLLEVYVVVVDTVVAGLEVGNLVVVDS